MKSVSLSSQPMQLTVILLSYLIFALIFGLAYRYNINPDGVAELRLAGYIAEGEFLRSVTASWSPLYIWLMSPFLYFGFEGLDTARIVIALSGAGLLVGGWFLSSRFDLPQNSRLAAGLIAALLISDWSIRNIGMDLMFAAMVTWYLYTTTNPDILNSKKASFSCGIIAGFSYLAHHYGLPFFLIHFPAILLLRGYLDKAQNRHVFKKALMMWAVGMAGFLIILSPWVTVVSAKYGRLTLSAKGSIAHAAVGPNDTNRRHPFFAGGLYMPRDPYAIHIFEDPSEITFPTWSPFENKEYLIFQINLIKNNAVFILNHFVNQSPFFTYAFMLGVLILIPVAFLTNEQNNKKKFLYFWIIITFIIFCSGFLVITARSPRRFYALMMVFLFTAVHFMEEIRNGMESIVGKKMHFLTFYLFMILVPAFALKPGIHLLKSLKNVITDEQVNPYSEIAEQINTIKFPSPYAMIRSSQKSYTDIYLAYYIRKQFLGRPALLETEGILKELKAAGAQSLLVFDNPEIAEALKNDGRFIHTGGLKLKEDGRYFHAANAVQDEIKAWDKEVNIFVPK